MKKRIFSVVIAILVIITSLPITVFAETGFGSQAFNDFTIRGNSFSNNQVQIGDFICSVDDTTKTCCICRYKNNTVENDTLIIPEKLGDYTVTQIGCVDGFLKNYNCSDTGSHTCNTLDTSIKGYWFDEISNLKNVILPISISVIGATAFCGCDELENINIPDGVTFIGGQAFNRCSSLKNISIPNEIEIICDYAFCGCERLNGELNIPSSCIYLGAYAFECTSFESITQTVSKNYMSVSNDNFTNIDYYLWGDYDGNFPYITVGSFAYINMPSLKRLEIIAENDVEYYLCAGASWSDALETVILPECTVGILGHSFEECSSLVNINIPDNVQHIGAYAFYNCTSLTEVNLPSKLFSDDNIFRKLYRTTTHGNYYSNNLLNCQAFDGCSNLKNITCNNAKLPDDYMYFSNGLKNFLTNALYFDCGMGYENDWYGGTMALQSALCGEIIENPIVITRGVDEIGEISTTANDEYIPLNWFVGSNSNKIINAPIIFPKSVSGICDFGVQSYNPLGYLYQHPSNPNNRVVVSNLYVGSWEIVDLLSNADDLIDEDGNKIDITPELLEESYYWQNIYEQEDKEELADYGCEVNYLRKIGFDLNGGSLDTDNIPYIICLDGEEIELSLSPKKEGKVFVGWSEAPNGDIVDNTYTVNLSKMLYAVYDTAINVNYIDKDGNSIAESETIPCKPNEQYVTKSKDIYGYELTTTPDNATGIATEEAITVNYIYELKDTSVQVNYIEQDNNKIADSIIIEGKVFDSYNTDSKEIYGYELMNVPSNANGNMVEETTIVDYIYELKDTKVITNFVDANGKELSESITTNGKVFDEYTTNSVDVYGYSVTTVPDNASGIMQEDTISVNYIYKLKPANVVVHYFDTDGNKISEDVVINGSYFEEYITEEKSIEGYLFKEVTENSKGTMLDDNIEVTYIYSTVPKEQTNEEKPPIDEEITPSPIENTKPNTEKPKVTTTVEIEDEPVPTENEIVMTGDYNNSTILLIMSMLLIVSVCAFILIEKKVRKNKE